MTASAHGPYIVPKNIKFKPKQKDIIWQTVEYADWSIKRFLQLASKEKWFANTIFVFIADHGYDVGRQAYDMHLSNNHVPLIIYAPDLIKEPKKFDNPGGQIDVFPTIMGLLNIPYVNKTMGIDLIKEKRPYIYFNADDKIGCVNDQFFYIYRTNGIESLYKYRNFDAKDYISQFKSKADSMKRYTFSMLQASQVLILNNKTGYTEVTK